MADVEYVEDIGLTWLTGKCEYPMWLSQEDAERFLPEGGPVEAMLALPEGAVTVFQRSYSRQLGEDVRRLLDSPLPDEVLHTVWRGATRYFDPAEHGMDARTWLRRVDEVWLARVRQDDPAYVPPPPSPVVDEELRRAVLEQIGAVADELAHAALHTDWPAPLPDLVPALEQVVTRACADLGYRLFLRAMNAYFVEIEPERLRAFEALGERFGYPEYLIGNLNVRWPPSRLPRRDFDEDFGLSSLAAHADGPWRAEVLTDRVRAAVLLEDALRLLESPLPTETISVLWSAASDQVRDGRELLREVVEVCAEHLRRLDPAYEIARPEESPALLDGHGDHILGVVRGAPLEPGERAALEEVVTTVDPDLGLRLCLRILVARRTPLTDMQSIPLTTAGMVFGYGHSHLMEVAGLEADD